MGQFRGVSHRFQHDDIRRRRLLFRSWHRWTQEIDLILGTFADARLTGFDRAQLDRFEALLDCADADLFDWIVGDSAPPEEYDHDIIGLLRVFWAQPHRRRNERLRLVTTTQEQS